MVITDAIDYKDYRSSLAKELVNKRKKLGTSIPWLKTVAKKINSSLAKNLLKDQKENNFIYRDARIKKYIDLLESKDFDVAENIDKSKKIPIFNKEIADLLISNGAAKLVGNNLKQFTWLDIETAKLFMKVWRNGYPEYVINNTEMFRWDLPEWESNKKIINLMIKNASLDSLIMKKNKKFPWMDRYIADKLIEMWYSHILLRDIRSFPWLDRLALANKMADYYRWWVELVEHIDEFPWLKPYDLMVTLLTKKQYRVVARYQKEFEKLGVTQKIIQTKINELLTDIELEDFYAYIGEKKEKINISLVA